MYAMCEWIPKEARRKGQDSLELELQTVTIHNQECWELASSPLEGQQVLTSDPSPQLHKFPFIVMNCSHKFLS